MCSPGAARHSLLVVPQLHSCRVLLTTAISLLKTALCPTATMSLLKILLPLLAPAVLTSGSELRDGACPKYTPEGRFDATRLEGPWYQFEEAGTPRGLKCIQVNYSVVSGGQVQYSSQAVRIAGGATIKGSGLATPIKRSVARFNVSMSGSPNTAIYDIIDTNYRDYIVAFHCTNHVKGNQTKRREILVVQTRERKPNLNVPLSIDFAMFRRGIDGSALRRAHQDSCR